MTMSVPTSLQGALPGQRSHPAPSLAPGLGAAIQSSPRVLAQQRSTRVMLRNLKGPERLNVDSFLHAVPVPTQNAYLQTMWREGVLEGSGRTAHDVSIADPGRFHAMLAAARRGDAAGAAQAPEAPSAMAFAEEPERGPEPEPERGPEPEAEAGPALGPALEADAGREPEPEAEAGPAPEPEAEAGPAPAREPEPEPEAGPVPEAEAAGPEPEVDPRPESEPEAKPGPKSVEAEAPKKEGLWARFKKAVGLGGPKKEAKKKAWWEDPYAAYGGRWGYYKLRMGAALETAVDSAGAAYGRVASAIKSVKRGVAGVVGPKLDALMKAFERKKQPKLEEAQVEKLINQLDHEVDRGEYTKKRGLYAFFQKLSEPAKRETIQEMWADGVISVPWYKRGFQPKVDDWGGFSDVVRAKLREEHETSAAERKDTGGLAAGLSSAETREAAKKTTLAQDVVGAVKGEADAALDTEGDPRADRPQTALNVASTAHAIGSYGLSAAGAMDRLSEQVKKSAGPIAGIIGGGLTVAQGAYSGLKAYQTSARQARRAEELDAKIKDQRGLVERLESDPDKNAEQLAHARKDLKESEDARNAAQIAETRAKGDLGAAAGKSLDGSTALAASLLILATGLTGGVALAISLGAMAVGMLVSGVVSWANKKSQMTKLTDKVLGVDAELVLRKQRMIHVDRDDVRDELLQLMGFGSLESFYKEHVALHAGILHEVLAKRARGELRDSDEVVKNALATANEFRALRAALAAPRVPSKEEVRQALSL